MIASLEEKTGRSLESWITVLAASPTDAFMASVVWLKSEHGLGHFQARLVVEEARKTD